MGTQKALKSITVFLILPLCSTENLDSLIERGKMFDYIVWVCGVLAMASVLCMIWLLITVGSAIFSI